MERAKLDPRLDEWIIELMNVRRSRDCRRSEQSRNQDTGDLQEELNDGGTYTQKDSGGDFSSAFMHDSSGFGTGEGTLFERKSTQATINGYYRRFSTVVNSQYRKKDVDASQHVLDTYHDSFLFGKVPTTVKVRAAIRGGKLGHFWHFVRTFEPLI